MPAFTLALFGSMQVRLADQVVTQFPTAKVQALLAYLAVEANATHSRDTLIGLFWPEYTTESARQNLRQTLFRLRQVIPPAFLLVTNQTVQFNPASDYRLDVTTFSDLITACHHRAPADLTACAECGERLQQAVALYRGDFLAGFFLDDSPAFEEWLLLKREWLRREALQALSDLAVYHERQGAYTRAQVYSWPQVELDPAREEAHQQLMRVLALSGRRSEALAQYESCRRLLAEELGVEPSVETVALYEQIRAGELGKRPGAPPPAADQPVSSVPRSTASAAPAIPLVIAATIRLVTVLCVGVSDAEEMHPEAAAQAEERLGQLSAPILAHYEARIEQSTGAGLVVLFGAGQTHEDDPERAVRAALAIRQAAKAGGLVVSAGISTGNILLAPSGAPAGLHTFAGSPVTLAVRLQGQAAPGQILVGESTYRQTHAAIQFTPLKLMLPGRSSTRTVYQAEHPQVRPQKSRGLAPLHADLVGRTKDLVELKNTLSAVQAGVGQLVLLSGEAGIGKSRLVTELKQVLDAVAAPEVTRSSPPAARSTPLLWLEGRCLEMMTAASYWPFLDILHTYLGWQSEQEETTRAERILATLDELVTGGHLRAVQREEMGPLLGNLLSVRFGTDWDERLKFAGPEQLRHQTLLCLRDFFLALSRQAPLVLVLEDLHWADSLSLDLITLLMEVLAAQPLLLLCVYRPEPQHRCWQLATLATAKCPDSLTEVRLRELTARQSQQLVEALLTIEKLTPMVKGMILQKAQGNPLFVEEVIRSLIDAGIVYCQDDTWQARAEIESVVIPESLQSVILSRVGRLSEVLQGVLQRAAVIGRVFGRRLLVQLMPAEVDLDNVVLALTNQAFIYQERMVPEEEYSFKHVLVQEAIYQTTLRDRREQFHRQVAEAMEQLYADNLAERYEQLAYHYDRSGMVEKAIEYLLKAGEKAQAAFANDTALNYYTRLLPLVSESVAQIDLHLQWGAVLERMGRWEEAETHYQDALARAEGNTTCTARCQFALGRLCHLRADYPVALNWLEQARVGWAVLNDQVGLAQALIELGFVFLRKGEYASAQRYLEEGLALAQEVDDQADVARALNNLGFVAAIQGDNTAARVLHEESLVLARQMGDKPGIALTLLNLGIVVYNQGDNTAARALHEESLALARQMGDRRLIAVSLSNVGTVASRQGDNAAARALHEESLALARQMGDKRLIAIVLDELGIVAYQQGDNTAARALYEESLALARQMDDKRLIAWTLNNLGDVAYQQGDNTAARALYEESLMLARQMDYMRAITMSLVRLGFVSLMQGNNTAARTLYEESLMLARQTGDRWNIVYTLVGLAGVAFHEGARGRAVRLVAASESLRTTIQMALEPKTRRMYDETVASTQAALGKERFALAWMEGQTMTLEEAIELAMEQATTPG